MEFDTTLERKHMKRSHRSLLRRLADRLLDRFVPRLYWEEFFGDLEESYAENLAFNGRFAAEVKYLFNALHLLYGFRSISFKYYSNRQIMFTGNFFRLAWRNAKRHKQFATLNLLGLVIGIATSLTIGLYVYDEVTYDRFFPNGNRIYRVNQPFIWGEWNKQFASTGPGVAEAIREDIPEFEEVTRLYNPGESTVRTVTQEPVVFVEQNLFWVDENFFKIFAFPFLKGDPALIMREPNSIVMTQRGAHKYFGDDDPVGKVVELKNNDGIWVPYTVKGVLADIPSKSHLQFDILCSITTLPEMKANGPTWIWTVFGTYGLVKEGTDINGLTKKMQTLPPKWASATTERVFNQKFEDYLAGKKWTLYLQPLHDIYLGSNPSFHRFGPSGNLQFVIIFGAIGILVQILSCINFMNLSTARSGHRAKEVGIRKVLGSHKATLVQQFIAESTLYVFVATLMAIVLTQFSLNTINTLADKHLTLLPHFANPLFVSVIVAFILTLGIVAGGYPAFYLSAFQPAETLKGKVRSGLRRGAIRNGLVVFQFTVSITLIICTFFVQKQLAYTSAMNIGILKDNVLQLQYMEQLGIKVDVLKNELAKDATFTRIAKSHTVPPNVWEGDRYKAEGPQKPVVDLSYFRIDEDYLPLIGAEFLMGRNFDRANPADKHKVILNEEAVRILGWGTRQQWKTDSPLGKYVIQAYGKEEKLEVIGVVKDFHFNSVKQHIAPLLIMHCDNDLHWSYHTGPLYLSMRINSTSVKNGDDMQAILDKVQARIKAIDPTAMFHYSFMDEEYNNTFRGERRMGVVLNLFTVLAVMIACLGLFGLAAFSAEDRLKELGIRKVMGAKVYELVFLFSSDFTRLVIIAIMLASPLAWLLTDKWLSNFAFRTSIDAWVFIAAAVSALTIASITISYQAISAARTNPINTLRRE